MTFDLTFFLEAWKDQNQKCVWKLEFLEDKKKKKKQPYFGEHDFFSGSYQLKRVGDVF